MIPPSDASYVTIFECFVEFCDDVDLLNKWSLFLLAEF